jgi:hypothetical protein
MSPLPPDFREQWICGAFAIPKEPPLMSFRRSAATEESFVKSAKGCSLRSKQHGGTIRNDTEKYYFITPQATLAPPPPSASG